jgi:hypothetical protein
MGKEIKQMWLLKPGPHYAANCMDSRHNPAKSQQNQRNLEQNIYDLNTKIKWFWLYAMWQDVTWITY